LWFQWKTLEKPWRESELPVDEVDQALFTAATQVIVYNGRRAKFWTSSWLDGMSLAAMFPTLFMQSKRKNHSVVEAIENDNCIRDVMQDIRTLVQFCSSTTLCFCWCFLHRQIIGSTRLRVSSSKMVSRMKNTHIYPGLDPSLGVINLYPSV
jgi:hypothetical protein